MKMSGRGMCGVGVVGGRVRGRYRGPGFESQMVRGIYS